MALLLSFTSSAVLVGLMATLLVLRPSLLVPILLNRRCLQLHYHFLLCLVILHYRHPFLVNLFLFLALNLNSN